MGRVFNLGQDGWLSTETGIVGRGTIVCQHGVSCEYCLCKNLVELDWIPQVLGFFHDGVDLVSQYRGAALYHVSVLVRSFRLEAYASGAEKLSGFGGDECTLSICD